MKRKKPLENTSVGVFEKKKVIQKTRLDGMLEAIEKRSDPSKGASNCYRVFQDFPVRERANRAGKAL